MSGKPISRLVYDVGFNVGQDSAFYLAQGHRVVAVEADPTLAERGRLKFSAEIASGRLRIVNVGIAEQEGTADFWICEDKPEFNSFHREIAARDAYRHSKIIVPTTRFKKVLEQHGTPYYLKIDIEGHDMLCLQDLDPADLPAFISVESECPVDARSDGLRDGIAVLKQLRELGYERFKLIDQRSFDSLRVPASPSQRLEQFADRVLRRPPMSSLPGVWRVAEALTHKLRLERRLQWRFPEGSSGVWGADTPGRWLRYDEAEKAYRHYRAQYFKQGDAVYHSFWCDWHAAKTPARSRAVQ
jgi:FkbM family methyltransferase